MMNRVLLAAVAMMAPTLVTAEAIRGEVTDHYTNRTVNQPYTTQECQNVRVPVYGQSNSDAADALIGALIGGAIGNQFGAGSGKDAMTILGAIAGADSARGSRQIVGYREERQCGDVVRYREETSRVYSHSTVTFKSDGQVYTFDFVK